MRVEAKNMDTRTTPIVHYSKCPVCQSKSIQLVLSAKDYTVSGQSFDVWSCQNCEARFTQSVPDEAHIGSFYESEEYISHSNTSKGLVNNLYQRVRNYTLDQKQKLITSVSGKSKGSILDIGCGTGEFLGKMKSIGWEARGLEPSDTARKQAQENHGLHISEPIDLFQLEEKAYDVITMWHVLEHVHQLHAYMDQIQKILKPDGKLIIAVPNYQSLDAEYYGDKWAAYDVPRHLYHFSPKSMNELLVQHSFELIQEKPMPFDAFYVSLLSEKYQHGQARLIPGFWTGFRSFMRSSQNVKTCSSVMYIAQPRA